jgi:hypothetical protein
MATNNYDNIIYKYVKNKLEQQSQINDNIRYNTLKEYLMNKITEYKWNYNEMLITEIMNKSDCQFMTKYTDKLIDDFSKMGFIFQITEIGMISNNMIATVPMKDFKQINYVIKLKI